MGLLRNFVSGRTPEDSGNCASEVILLQWTANTLNIPPPLMDRMEIIRIAGYTEDEKVEIARKHRLRT